MEERIEIQIVSLSMMTSDTLYKVQKKDLPALEALLTRCFFDDPLYRELIPDDSVRRRLMPKLFACDMTEFFENCEIFSDSDRLSSILVVSDESEPYPFLKYYLTELQATLKTDGYLIKEDLSMKTLYNFVRGRDYLNSQWTSELPERDRIHIIYLAVDPQEQHKGIAAKLVGEVVRFAHENHLMISLETHNQSNVAFYQRFGFRLYNTIEKRLHLKQYCLVREPQ